MCTVYLFICLHFDLFRWYILLPRVIPVHEYFSNLCYLLHSRSQLYSKFLSYQPQQCKFQTLFFYTHYTAAKKLQTRPNIFICMKLSLFTEIMTKNIEKWTQGPEKHCPSWHCETHPLSWMMHIKEATVDKKWIWNLSSVLFLAVLLLTRTMQCPGLQWKHVP